MAYINESEYQGNPVIQIKRSEQDRYGLSMGLSKARLVIENIEAIKNFVSKHDKSSSQAGQ